MEKFIYGLGYAAVVIIIYTIIGALCAYPVMLLWNWLVPSIFHLREISFWEAWGLLILSSFLFKSTSTNSNNK